VPVQGSQRCLFLPPPLSNKIFSFYIIVFNGLALGGAARIMKTPP